MSGVALRLLCWNVRGLRDDVDALVATVRAARPHVAVLQEGPRVWRWRTRSAALASRCGLLVASSDGSGLSGTRGGLVAGASGNLLLADLAVTLRGTTVIRLDPTRGQHPRAAAVLRGTLAGAPFTIAGVHLGLTGAERTRHLPALLGALDGEQSLIVAGDLNEPPGGPAWQALGARLADTAGGDETPTYSTRDPRRRIDAVFADRALAVTSYEVLDSAEIRRASDHRPIAVTLSLSAAGR